MKLDALVMAGGKGERLGKGEKPLVPLAGRSMIDHVLEALEGSTAIHRIVVATSPSTPETEVYLSSMGQEFIRAPGNGFVEDLQWCIKELGLGKTLVVSSDLPLLTPADIDLVAAEYQARGRPSMAVVVPLEVMESHGLEATLVMDGMVPAGVNVVDGGRLSEEDEGIFVTEHVPFALNVNTPKEVELAESLLITEVDKIKQGGI